MFTKGFAKTADVKNILKNRVATSAVVDKGLAGLPNRQRYGLIGKPVIGKSGNKLTPEYMLKRYGVAWKEPA